MQRRAGHQNLCLGLSNIQRPLQQTDLMKFKIKLRNPTRFSKFGWQDGTVFRPDKKQNWIFRCLFEIVFNDKIRQLFSVASV